MGWGSCRARRESSVDIRNEFRRRGGVLREFLRVAVREVLVEALRGETPSRHAIGATSFNGGPGRGARTGMCMNTNNAVITGTAHHVHDTARPLDASVQPVNRSVSPK